MKCGGASYGKQAAAENAVLVSQEEAATHERGSSEQFDSLGSSLGSGRVSHSKPPPYSARPCRQSSQVSSARRPSSGRLSPTTTWVMVRKMKGAVCCAMPYRALCNAVCSAVRCAVCTAVQGNIECCVAVQRRTDALDLPDVSCCTSAVTLLSRCTAPPYERVSLPATSHFHQTSHPQSD